MLVLSERPQVERKLERSLEAQPLPVALAEISSSFHLYWVRRPRTLVFQRRYLDPREMPDLEVEEIAAVTGDLYRLVHSFAPYPIDLTTITDKIAFFKSLQPAQLQAMQQEKGLPLARLSPEQQALWSKINTLQGYGNMNLELGRMDRLFSGWNRSDLSYLTRRTLVPGGGGTVQKTSLWLRWPDPAQPEGVESYNMPEQGTGFSGSFPARPAGQLLGPRETRLPGGFNRRARIAETDVTLAAMMRAVESSGLKVAAPPYAGARLVLVYAGAASAADLLTAIEDLYGWNLHEQTGGRWSIGRISPGLTRDPRELYRRFQAALPACVYRLWDREAEPFHVPRYLGEWPQIHQQITQKLGDGWKTAELGKLDPSTQRSLANLILDRYVRAAVQGFTQRPVPQWWLIEPEKGYFTLDGETGPGKHPLMEFRVKRPDGEIDAWGWGVGTSSLEN